MKKISIVFFSTYGDNQFKSRRINNYLKLFEENKYFCQFIGIGKNLVNSDSQYIKINNSNVTMIIYTFTHKLFKAIGFSTFARYISIWFLSQIAKKKILNSDYLFTQAYFYSLIKFAKKNKIKVIIEHDADYPQHNWNIMRLANKQNKIKHRNRDPWNFYPYVVGANKALVLADKIIIFSNYSASTFNTEGSDKNKILISSPPADSSFLEIKTISHGRPKFYWIGNHGIRKGLHLLESAWCEYSRQGGIGELHLCGEVSPSQKYIRKRMQKLSNVFDHGKTDIYNFLSVEKQILVSPSISEGLPRAAVESAFAGNPIIATFPGGSELITEGHSGWKIETNVNSLLNGLFQAELDWDKVELYGVNARNEVLSKTKNYYKDVLSLFINESNNY